MRLLILLMVLAAPGWGAWSVCKAVTVNSGQVTSGPHSNFKMVISGTYSWLASTANGGVMTDAQGDDLRVYSTSDCSTTAIAYQRVYWTNTGVIELWVRVSSMDNGSVVYIGAGDAAVTTDGSNPAGVWAEEEYVYLFSGNVNDSSANARDLTNNGASSVAGKVGGAFDFYYAGAYMARNSAVNATSTSSFCGWLYLDTIDTLDRRIFDHMWFAPIDLLYVDSVTGLTYQYKWSTTNGSWYASAPGTAAWHHVCVTYDATSTSNDPAIYIDGSAQSVTENSTPAGSASSGTNEAIHIGNRATTNKTLDGKVDVFVRGNVIWSAGHISTMYANQNAPDTFYTITDAGGASTRRRVIVIQ